LTNGSREHPAVQVRMKSSKEEIDEIKDVLEDSLKYYRDLLDVTENSPVLIIHMPN
jgi:hypothetical protein